MKNLSIAFLLPFFAIIVAAATLDETKTESYLLQQEQFVHAYGSDWTFRWNAHQTPHRIFGSKIAHFFDAHNASVSEQMARRFISENSFLFRLANVDLELWVNDRKGNIRYLIFNQIYRGIPVWNARIDFRYTLSGDLVLIGHDAFPDLQVETTPVLTGELATIAAQADVEFDESRGDFVIGKPAEFVWVEKGEIPVYHLAWLVELFTRPEEIEEGELPAHRWKIFVDAHSGDILEKIDLAASTTISGYVTGPVKDDPYGNETVRGLPYVKVQIDGVGNAYTDVTGFYSIDIGTQDRTATVKLEGMYLNTNNANGSDATIIRTVTPGNTEDFHFGDENSIPGERDTYFHGNVVHGLAKVIEYDFTGADYVMPANVNIGPEDPLWPCNAYWDGYGINLFSEGGGCAGTDEMADVVYHEYGHGLQQFIYDPYPPPYSSGMGEGCSDYWAMTITDNSCMGNGFFGMGTCLRDGNNMRQYPAPECGGEVHCLGEITMGALWKMRENLIGSLGYDVAKAHADSLFFFAQIARPYEIPDFLTEILLADDDDGFLINGTPNYGDICDAFETHNVSCPFEDIGIEHTPLGNTVNTSAPYVVEAIIVSIYGEIDSVTLHYSIGADYVSVPMILEGDLYVGSIPAQYLGTVVDYYIHATDSEGNEIFAPHGAPLVTYLFLVGVEEDFQVPFKDDLEEDQSWTVGAPGDDAVTGIWTRADPNGTYVNGTPVQPENDHTPDGSKAFVTGNAPFTGSNAGEDDVDDGRTTLLSPIWDLSYVTNPVLGYWRWYSNNAGASPGQDVWEVDASSDGGQTWVSLESTTLTANSWIQKQFRLNKYVDVTDQMQVRFVASDEDAGSLVEAAVDDVIILGMTAFSGTYGDVNADGIVAVEDIVLIIDYILGRIEFTYFQRIAADMDGDHDVDILDVIQIVNVILGSYGAHDSYSNERSVVSPHLRK